MFYVFCSFSKIVGYGRAALGGYHLKLLSIEIIKSEEDNKEFKEKLKNILLFRNKHLASISPLHIFGQRHSPPNDSKWKNVNTAVAWQQRVIRCLWYSSKDLLRLYSPAHFWLDQKLTVVFKLHSTGKSSYLLIKNVFWLTCL